MRKLVLTAVGSAALAFATAASASVTLGSKGAFCSPGGCTAGTSTATVTENVLIPNKIEFDDTNASAGTQTGWFDFFVNPAMLGTFSATVATYPASTVTLLELLTGSADGTTQGTTLVTSTPGTQLTWSNLTANTWYTFRYTANMSTAGSISGNATFYPAVPEPAAWALMLLGFGGIGLAMRRRRRPALAQLA
jgi:PEP-CTERM motif